MSPVSVSGVLGGSGVSRTGFSGVSNAGRAWCHGASEAASGAASGFTSGDFGSGGFGSGAGSPAGRCDAEPWLTLRVRRGVGAGASG
ncbi:MAG: hypothetical protein WCD21_38280, partial [Streptomyces sp.]